MRVCLPEVANVNDEGEDNRSETDDATTKHHKADLVYSGRLVLNKK